MLPYALLTLCVLSMSLGLILDLVSCMLVLKKSKPKVMVVILKNGFALIFQAQSSSVQICAMNARSRHKLSLCALLICLESLR